MVLVVGALIVTAVRLVLGRRVHWNLDGCIEGTLWLLVGVESVLLVWVVDLDWVVKI